MLGAPLTNRNTVITTVAANAEYGTITAGSAIRAPAIIILSTVFTHDAAALTKSYILTIGAGLPASFTKRCTIAASFPAIAQFGTGTAGIAVGANIVVSHPIGAFFALVADPVSTLGALCTAALTNYLAVFTTALTALADQHTALAKATIIAEII